MRNIKKEPIKKTNYETNLTYMMARYYSQGYGRFLSPDPGYDYDQLDPMSWNLYAYVRGNPVAFLDPLGKKVEVYYDKKNNQFLIKIEVKVVKPSDMKLTKAQIAKLTKKIKEFIENTYTEQGTMPDGTNVSWKTEAKVSYVDNLNGIKPDDHILFLYDYEEDSPYAGEAAGIPSNSATINVHKLLNDDDEKNYDEVADTAAHELGHMMGLTHFNPKGRWLKRWNIMGRYWGINHKNATPYYKKQRYRHTFWWQIFQIYNTFKKKGK